MSTFRMLVSCISITSVPATLLPALALVLMSLGPLAAQAQSLSPSSIDFGDQPAHALSPAQTLTFTNTAGTPVELTGVSLVSVNAPLFGGPGLYFVYDDLENSESCVWRALGPDERWTVMNPGEACTVSVLFNSSGTTSTTYLGELSISYRAPGESPQTLVTSLTGSATGLMACDPDLNDLPGSSNVNVAVTSSNPEQESGRGAGSPPLVKVGQASLVREVATAISACSDEATYIGNPDDWSTWIAIGSGDVNVIVEQETVTMRYVAPACAPLASKQQSAPRPRTLALPQACTLSWANPASGNWNEAANWDGNRLPTAGDDVCITLDGTYSVTTVGFTANSLTLGGGSGSQTLVIRGDVTLGTSGLVGSRGIWAWREGFLQGGGLVNQGTVRVFDTSTTRGITGSGTLFRNEGTVDHSQAVAFTIANGATVENAGLWRFSDDGSIAGGTGTGLLENLSTGAFRKTGGTGLTLLGGSGLTVVNEGLVEAEAGEIRFDGPSTHSAALFHAATEAAVRLEAGPVTFAGTSAGCPAGIVALDTDFTAAAEGAAWDFEGTGLAWMGGTLTAGTLTNEGLVHLTGGSTTRGVVGAVLRNEGTVEHADAGHVAITDGGTVENAGVWDLTGTGVLSGTASLVNENGGVLRKSSSTEAAQLAAGLTVSNSGTIAVEAGKLDVDATVDHRPGGLIQGIGTFDIQDATFIHDGDTGPGTSPGALAWSGDYTIGASAYLIIEIEGENGAGATGGHDQLQITGDVDFTNGTLDIIGSTEACATPPCAYVIMTWTGTRTGDFATKNLPPGTSVLYDDASTPRTATLEAFQQLPVELVAFDATVDGGAVALTWQTASETNNAGFEIQRISKNVRADGRPSEVWEILAFVEGHGTTADPRHYRFTDASLPFEARRLVYRLKQIDYDGTFDYSPEVEVTLSVPERFALHGAYPNPFNLQTTIRYALPRATAVRLVVYDVLGREVARLVEGVKRAGRHETIFDAAQLPSGLYLYRLETDSFWQTRRMLLVK